jgi:uncharacterized phage protein gp47/JayE
MSYSVPTFAAMQAFLNALLKALDPLANVNSKYAPHWKRTRAVAAVATDVHANVQSAARDVMPDTATGPTATRWGKIFGVAKKGATGARKANALRVRGTVASTVSIGDELLDPASGLLFGVAEDATIPVAGYIDIDVAATSTGSQTRLLAGTTLNFTAPPAGIETAAVLQLDMDEDGTDAELDPAYRNRYLARAGAPKSGGNQDDYVSWSLEVDGIASAYCYPSRAGLGTVDVAAFHVGSGTARFLTPTERDELEAYLIAKAPAQVMNALRVLEAIEDPRVVEVTILPSGDAAAAFDWDDSTAPVVLVWTPGTRTLQFASARPASMQAGHRLSFTGLAAHGHDGGQWKIEALVSTDSVLLEEIETGTPTAGDLVYSGGPLVDPIRDALAAYVNGETIYGDDDAPIAASAAGSTVNLKVLTDGVGPANPGLIYGTWSGSLVRSAIGAIASYPRSVREVTIVQPPANVDATDYAFPNDNQIGVITPFAVTVRKAW